MRKRDLGILLLSAFAIFFSLQQEGDFSFREAWFHLADEYPIKYESERLPPPIVADLNGDGRKEVLVATHDAKIEILEPHSRHHEGAHEARLLAEVSLLPDKVRVVSGRRPVAMAVGVIDRFHAPGDMQKQVLVVVTSSWLVMCFDHNLKKLWENNLQENFPHGAHHKEIAISISNYTLKHGDSGLVIVGGRMEMQSPMYLDPFEDMMESEKSTEEHRRSAAEKEASDNSRADDLRHFAFFAFAGRTGTLRWTKMNHEGDVHFSDVDQSIPQHNYKLDAHALNSRLPGEFECREFRESLLQVMPHHWERREDTAFKLAHFRKHKRKSLKKSSGKNTGFPFHKPEEQHAPGKDSKSRVPRLIGNAADVASSSKSRKWMPYIPPITNYTKLWWVPNVVVAHQKEGLEVLHLATGRTICKLHLLDGGLHADINGDGVLDHVQVVGKSVAKYNVLEGMLDAQKPCWAIATSGVPVREQIFNVSICHHGHFFQHAEFFKGIGEDNDPSSLEVASPILFQMKDSDRHKRGTGGDLIFLTSRGEVTSYEPGLQSQDVTWKWQLITGATWSNLHSLSGMMESNVIPTLKVMPLQVGHVDEVILAAGDQEAVVLSPTGYELASFDLPSPPVHALITEDFSNDGLTDIILSTSSGVYGFVQIRHLGALFFSTLVGCLILVMGVIFVSQHMNSKGKPRVSGNLR